MSKNNNSGSFILGTLLGAAVGGVLGLLYAPRSGEETRRQIEDDFDQLKTKANEYKDLAVEKGTSLYQEFTAGEEVSVPSDSQAAQLELPENLDTISSEEEDIEVELDFGMDEDIQL